MRWTIGLERPMLQVIAIMLSFGLATLSYRFVETPVRRSRALAGVPSGRIVLGGMIAMIATSAVVGATIYLRPVLSRSVTADPAWSPYRQDPVDAHRCGVPDRRRSFGGGDLYRLRTSGCGPDIKRRLFVLGDSHARAYLNMLGWVARSQHVPIDVYALAGCAVMEPSVIDGARPAMPACDAFETAALRAIAADAQPGDILFLPGLRTPRYDAEGEAMIRHQATHPLDHDHLPSALQPTLTMLRPLLDRGIRVIIEAPKPVFAFPPIRCTDWFNRDNPVCAPGPFLPRATAIARRAETMTMLAVLAEEDRRIRIWDPFDILCPGERCDAYRGDHALVLDGDHLTGFGNRLIAPQFAETLRHYLVAPARDAQAAGAERE